jgi:lipopolysaccharide/colanic/teichoic acid biosynthesis glycosyltransferase
MRYKKRVFDFAGALLGLFVLWPLFLLVAMIVKMGDGGPVLYRQVRIGYKGCPFVMYKFRTMVVNADRTELLLTPDGDTRITGFGRLIRNTKIDELPQLWNVLRGQMSLVGPRPEVSKFVALYTVEQQHVLNLVPGITDPASIIYRNEGALLKRSQDPETHYIQMIMPDKIRRNLTYAMTATIYKDALVILQTFFTVFLKRDNADAPIREHDDIGIPRHWEG